MASVQFDGFIGGAYQARSWKAATQRCVNMYLEIGPEKGKVLYGTPGLNVVSGDLSSVITLDKYILGLLATPKGLIVATERSVYRVQSVTRSGSGYVFSGSILLGTFGPSNYVSMAQAGDRAMIVNGSTGVWIDLSTPSMAPITDSDFPAFPKSCTAVDGLFIVHSDADDKFYWSAPFDPSSWDALDFISAENINDAIQASQTVERELYIVGEQSTEVFASVGGDDVFDRISGTFIPYGTPSHQSVASVGQSLLFLGQDQYGGGFVVQVSGLQARRVSTHAIEEEIASYSTISDAYAFSYQQVGHAFYCLTFPTERKTWVYDLSTSLWHERTSPEMASGVRSEVQWGARCHAYYQGVNLVGAPYSDTYAARVAALDLNYHFDNDMPMKRARVSPHVFSGNDYVSVSAIDIVMQPGVGVATSALPYQVNPVGVLRISKDGGKTYSYTRSAELGEQGRYKSRCRFNRIGMARDIVAEFSVSDPVSVAITDAQIEVS